MIKPLKIQNDNNKNYVYVQVNGKQKVLKIGKIIKKQTYRLQPICRPVERPDRLGQSPLRKQLSQTQTFSVKPFAVATLW